MNGIKNKRHFRMPVAVAEQIIRNLFP